MLKNYLPSNLFILSNFKIDFSDFVRWFIRDVSWNGQSFKHQAKITVNDAFYRSVYHRLAITEFIVSLESFIQRPGMWFFFTLLCYNCNGWRDLYCLIPHLLQLDLNYSNDQCFWLMAEWWNLVKFWLLSRLILGLLLKWPLGPVLFNTNMMPQPAEQETSL